MSHDTVARVEKDLPDSKQQALARQGIRRDRVVVRGEGFPGPREQASARAAADDRPWSHRFQVAGFVLQRDYKRFRPVLLALEPLVNEVP